MHQQELLEEWFEQYGEAVLTYIIVMVRDYTLAEDLTQETFLKAYKAQHRFQQNASVKTWLFAIAANTTKDYLRKKNPLKYYLNLTLHEPDDQPIPEQLVTMNETNEQLYLALQQLKPSYREVILLRKLKDFSTKETAIILGWSESKVKMNLKRALKAMRLELEKRGYTNEVFRQPF